MGNRCGDIALFAGIATGAELVITPETGFNLKDTMKHLSQLDTVSGKKHAIVVISEKLTDVDDLAVQISAQTFSGRSTVLDTFKEVDHLQLWIEFLQRKWVTLRFQRYWLDSMQVLLGI